jgi:hypothetical protein
VKATQAHEMASKPIGFYVERERERVRERKREGV